MERNGRELAPREPPAARCGSKSRAAAGGGCPSPVASQLRLQDLPSELIGRVLALAGRRHAASAAATCRQLNATFWSQPALWQDIQLAVSPRVACMGGPQLVAWCAAQRCWLQRVAPMVRQARFVSCEPEASGGEPSTMEMTVVGCHIADLLHALEGAPLERLFMEVWRITFEWDDAVALRRCGGSLRQLRLGPPNPGGGDGWCRLPAGAAGTLRSMHQLRAVQLSVERLAVDVLDVICGLASLEILHLHSSNPVPPGLSKLSVLHNLADLVLHEAFSSATGMQLPEPAVMEGLTRLQLGGRRIQVPPSGALTMMRGCDTPGGTSPCILTMWECQCCTNRTLVLEDVCLEHSAGLLSLLRAGGAAGGTLESLHFEQCHLVAAGLAPPAGDAGEEQEQALEELAFLVVKECYGEDWDGGIEPALAELLSQAPELVGLTIKDSAVSSAVLPDLLEGLQLDSLALEGCGLESFPPFEGLEVLESLFLARNRLPSLPHSLVAATSLVDLDLSGNPNLLLSETSVGAVLSEMPNLRRLKIWGTAARSPWLLLYLRTRLPQLEVVTERPASPQGGTDAELEEGEVDD